MTATTTTRIDIGHPMDELIGTYSGVEVYRTVLEEDEDSIAYAYYCTHEGEEVILCSRDHRIVAAVERMLGKAA